MQKLHILTRVPEHVIDTPQHIGNQQRWQRRYNVAGWVRFEDQDHSAVTLILRYKDASGVRDLNIDRGHISSKTLLLSGVANLKLTGRIEQMELLVQCDSSRFTVDELFVQPVKEKNAFKSRPRRHVLGQQEKPF